MFFFLKKNLESVNRRFHFSNFCVRHLQIRIYNDDDDGGWSVGWKIPSYPSTILISSFET